MYLLALNYPMQYAKRLSNIIAWQTDELSISLRVINWAMRILFNPRVPLGIKLLIPLRLSNHPFLDYVDLLF